MSLYISKTIAEASQQGATSLCFFNFNRKQPAPHIDRQEAEQLIAATTIRSIYVAHEHIPVVSTPLRDPLKLTNRKMHLCKLLQQDGCEVMDHGTYLTGTIPKFSKLISQECVGKGTAGWIFSYKSDCSFVLKQFPTGLFSRAKKEFSIGHRLNHPNINKIYAMITSRDTSEERPYALVMDKVEGTLLWDALLASRQLKLMKKELIHLVHQIKDFCLYLFKNQISLSDFNHRNIFILKDKNFKVIDFEAWGTSDALHVQAANILFCAMFFIRDLVKQSELKKKEGMGFPQGQIKEHSYLQLTIDMVNFFKCKREASLFDFSQFEKSSYIPIIHTIGKYLYWKNDVEIKKFIGNYFDRVVQRIEA